MAKKRKPLPIAPPPQSTALRSRKRARQVTTLFHKYTQELDLSIERARQGGCDEDLLSSMIDCSDKGSDDNIIYKSTSSEEQKRLLNEVRKWKDKISEIGGREGKARNIYLQINFHFYSNFHLYSNHYLIHECRCYYAEYQRASQLNTSLFSTSKWVLGMLGRWGWLNGISLDEISDDKQQHQPKQKCTQKKKSRRDVRLLEIGAINTQLLDAAARTRIERVATADNEELGDGSVHETTNKVERVHRLQVKAIDLRSTNSRIEQQDFFELPISKQPYDVLVCSMVINCVTTPEQRGKMLTLCYNQLRPGGVCFLMLPKLCLIQSKYMTRSYFEQILTKGVGFELDSSKDSPKVSFFVLKRPQHSTEEQPQLNWDDKFARMTIINKGKKFRNLFAVTLDKKEVNRR